MKRYQHAERMIRGITWQGKKELYAVLLRDLKRTDTTEQDLQHEYDKYRRAEMMHSYGASERQIETMLKESDEMNTHRASAPWLDTPWLDTPVPSAPTPQAPQCPAPCARGLEPAERVALMRQEMAEAEAALAAKNERDALAAKIDAEIALAEATLTLLADIRILRLTNNQTHRRKEFATYRKELAALAASYDVKIVLVGDKSAAVLVLD